MSPCQSIPDLNVRSTARNTVRARTDETILQYWQKLDSECTQKEVEICER